MTSNLSTELRKILDIYIDRVKVNYIHETQQHNLDIHYRYPLMNDGIEYVTDKNSRIKWDKWGKGYKIKDGEKVYSIETTDFFFTSKPTHLTNPKNYQSLFNSN